MVWGAAVYLDLTVGGVIRVRDPKVITFFSGDVYIRGVSFSSVLD